MEVCCLKHIDDTHAFLETTQTLTLEKIRVGIKKEWCFEGIVVGASG